MAPPGIELGLSDPERRPQGSKNRQNDRKWRPDEHRRPVGLTSVSAHVRRNACKMLAESSGRLPYKWVRRASGPRTRGRFFQAQGEGSMPGDARIGHTLRAAKR